MGGNWGGAGSGKMQEEKKSWSKKREMEKKTLKRKCNILLTSTLYCLRPLQCICCSQTLESRLNSANTHNSIQVHSIQFNSIQSIHFQYALLPEFRVTGSIQFNSCHLLHTLFTNINCENPFLGSAM